MSLHQLAGERGEVHRFHHSLHGRASRRLISSSSSTSWRSRAMSLLDEGGQPGRSRGWPRSACVRSRSRDASPTSAATGVRSSWATSATKRRSRACPASRSNIFACRFSAMRLNDDPSTPNSSLPFGKADVEVALGHDRRRSARPAYRAQQSPGHPVSGQGGQDGQHHSRRDEHVSELRQPGLPIGLAGRRSTAPGLPCRACPPGQRRPAAIVDQLVADAALGHLGREVRGDQVGASPAVRRRRCRRRPPPAWRNRP